MDDLTFTPDLGLAAPQLLNSLGIGDAAEIDRLAGQLVASTALEDADLLNNVAVTRLGEWFARCLQRDDLSAEQAFVIGRAAFVAVDGAGRWPGVLLSEAPPADFLRDIVGVAVQPCPPPLPAVMPTQNLENHSALAWIVRVLRGAPAHETRAA
jgi:hypothetical protein